MNECNPFDSHQTPQTPPSQSTPTRWNAAPAPSNPKKGLSFTGAIIIAFVILAAVAAVMLTMTYAWNDEVIHETNVVTSIPAEAFESHAPPVTAQ